MLNERAVDASSACTVAGAGVLAACTRNATTPAQARMASPSPPPNSNQDRRDTRRAYRPPPTIDDATRARLSRCSAKCIEGCAARMTECLPGLAIVAPRRLDLQTIRLDARCRL